jgi:1-deoxy-D-xylulose-5-phosphate reductoisomerase
MPTIMNAANEVSVELFLHNKIKFLQIGDIIEESMLKFTNSDKIDLDSILEIDFKVREEIKRIHS